MLPHPTRYPVPGQPVFALFPYCCVLSEEATHINVLVFSLTRSGLESTIYHTRGEHTNHNTTDAVVCCYLKKIKCVLKTLIIILTKFSIY